MVKVLIAGGKGLIGRALSADLVQHGHEVYVLSRSPQSPVNSPIGVKMITWDGKTTSGWADVLNQVDAVVNLAGAPLDGKNVLDIWLTEKRKKQLVSSRLDTSRALIEGIRLAENKPKVYVQGSAVGYYGFSGDEFIDESSNAGNDYFAEVQISNEQASEEVKSLGLRRVIIRTGLVLDRKDGSFQYFKFQTALFVGGRMGSGEQYYSWIHVKDEAAAIRFLIEHEEASGPFNLTAPNPVKNKVFARVVAQVMRRPSFFVIPAFLMRLVLGEVSAIILKGNRVVPSRLQELGFEFQYPKLKEALEDILN